MIVEEISRLEKGKAAFYPVPVKRKHRKGGAY
jgi:hypothetical protein